MARRVTQRLCARQVGRLSVLREVHPVHLGCFDDGCFVQFEVTIGAQCRSGNESVEATGQRDAPLEFVVAAREASVLQRKPGGVGGNYVSQSAVGNERDYAHERIGLPSAWGGKRVLDVGPFALLACAGFGGLWRGVECATTRPFAGENWHNRHSSIALLAWVCWPCVMCRACQAAPPRRDLS